jgi:hypothetical protein
MCASLLQTGECDQDVSLFSIREHLQSRTPKAGND